MAAPPEIARVNGQPVVPLLPAGPPTPWIVLGPRTRQQMAAVLEPQLGAVWLALLETSGVPEGQPWTLVIDGAHLEPAALPPKS